MIKSKKLDLSSLKKIFLIAECGINHNGNLNYAKKLISGAKKAGFDAVKFQTYNVDHLVEESTKLANYQKKTKYKSQYYMLKKYAFSKEQFLKLKNYCDKLNIIFMSTPFDLESAKYLNENLNVQLFKLSSADLNNYQLLNYIKKTKKPIILSTGMSTKKMLEESLKFLNYPKKNFAVLHCISEYPTAIKNTFLGNLSELKKKYIFGLSDHTSDEHTSIAASVLGIKILEKHITISKKLKGPDHQASITLAQLKKFVQVIRDLEKSSKQINFNLTKNEKKNFNVTRRKLYFKKDLKKGTILNFENILPLRSSNKQSIDGKDILKILGKKIKRDVKKLEPIHKNIL
jgi:N,N'-diacetyllegionaminate synthase